MMVVEEVDGVCEHLNDKEEESDEGNDGFVGLVAVSVHLGYGEQCRAESGRDLYGWVFEHHVIQ